jgi:hypothetical protein
MGRGSWTSDAFKTYASNSGLLKASSVGDVYKSKRIQFKLDPKGIKIRESRDSPDHPKSTPVIIGLDVTGSMGHLAVEIAKNQLNELITKIYDEKPIPDPQVMIAAIGDSYCDSAPLQVTQFESDIRIAEQLQDVYFEAGGGGNHGESYNLVHYFASKHTEADAFKRGDKGFIFTIGDEPCLEAITKEQIKTITGDDVTEDIKTKAIIEDAKKNYNVFHLIVKPRDGSELEEWKDLLGENAVLVKDTTKIPQLIVDLMKASKMSTSAAVAPKKGKAKKEKVEDVVLD